MSENMSIDEIIRQAEEIRKKTVAKAHSAIEEVKAEALSENNNKAEAVEEDDVKAYPIKEKAKTSVVDSEEIKRAVEATASGMTQAVELKQKTAVVPNISNADAEKKSFFKTRAVEPLYSKNPPEIIERPATIKSKSRLDHTSDLEEVPTIVAVDELENTKISISPNHMQRQAIEQFVDDEGEQIVLDGFENVTDKVSKIDEELAEEQLKRRRQEKINKFRLFSPDAVGEEKSEVKNEFKKNDDKTAFMEKLFATRSSFTLKASITMVLGGALLILTLLKDSSYLPSFLLDYTVFHCVSLVIYLAILAVNFKNILFGFRVKNKINYSLPISIASIVVLLHTIALIVNTNLYIDDGISLVLVMAFAFLMTNIGKKTLTDRIIANFEFLINQEGKYTVETIANTVDATIISRGLLTGEPSLKTSIKTDFPTNYLDISGSDEPADSIARTTGMIMLGLSALLFIVISIIKGNWNYGFNVGVCAMCISLPVISIFNTNSALLGVSKLLSKNGAMVNGFEGAAMVNNANAIVLEAQDLFGRSSCEIHGIKTFNGAKADDVILKTAAVIMKTKSPLSYVFDDVIVGKQTILPDVDGVVYEDRLGTSAWIYRKKILVGTRELLIHHGVPVPKEEFEQKYTRKGRKILYLAVTGQVMAMFVVSYSADPKLKKSLRRLEKSGITILVKSSDPFINDESIAELFSLPEGFVRVMNSSNARVFEKYSNMCVEKSPAYVIHNGSALGFVSSMAAAENIEETKKLLSVLITFGSVMGFGLVAMLGIINGLTQINPVNIIIFQSVWCIFVELVTKLKRLGI